MARRGRKPKKKKKVGRKRKKIKAEKVGKKAPLVGAFDLERQTGLVQQNIGTLEDKFTLTGMGQGYGNGKTADQAVKHAEYEALVKAYQTLLEQAKQYNPETYIVGVLAQPTLSYATEVKENKYDAQATVFLTGVAYKREPDAKGAYGVVPEEDEPAA